MSDEITTTSESDLRIARIPASGQGGDPLVADYADRHRAHCAVRILSWRFLFWSFPLLIGTAIIGNLCWGPVPDPPLWVAPHSAVWWLHQLSGNLWGVLLGLFAGALVLANIATVLHRVSLATTKATTRATTKATTRATTKATSADSAGSEPGEPSPVLAIVQRLVGYHGQNMAQEPWYAACVLAPLYLLVHDPLIAASVLTSLVAAVYIGVMTFRLLALLLGHRSPDIDLSVDAEWPVYTVLVPLYREEAVAQKILKNLTALDYPKDRLDVKFLLEADDPGTLAALKRDGIPEWCEVIVVPDAQPKTKPRACNHGLARARGSFLVIFDAEDRPESDQLKKAVLAFAAIDDPRVVCLQAQLAYHNHRQNLLTRWFAIEYNVWFQRYLNGLHRLGGPLPLGGTSNHFRTAALKTLDGWDPFNVTEDCDLGIRLHVAGHRTATLDSVTWEEANSRVGNWLRQRSRWLKGYLVTHVVWCRHPLRLVHSLGPLGTIRFFASILGIAGLAILNLPLWIMLSVYTAFLTRDMGQGWGVVDLLTTPPVSGDGRWSWPLLYFGNDEAGWWNAVASFLGRQGPFPEQDPVWAIVSLVFALVTLLLLVANGLFIAINVIFGHRAQQRGLMIAALFTPLYWVLISLAGWKGLWQLCFNPHKWEKTVHGLDHHDSDQHTPQAP